VEPRIKIPALLLLHARDSGGLRPDFPQVPHATGQVELWTLMGSIPLLTNQQRSMLNLKPLRSDSD
jgi:hypothetical protein